MHNDHQPHSESALTAPRGFAEWGLGEVAYVKLEDVGGNLIHVVRAANGESLAAAESHDLAVAMIIQNDMTPLTVH